MRNVVLASNEASKRKRSSPEESGPENRLSKKVFQVNKSKPSGQTPAPNNIIEDKPPATSSEVKKTISPVLSKFSQGKTYADVLRKLRKEMNPEASGSRVVSDRATQKGDVLKLLDKESNKEGFTPEGRRVVEGLREVRADPKKVTLEIHDLDPLTTKEEVKVELKKALRNE